MSWSCELVVAGKLISCLLTSSLLPCWSNFWVLSQSEIYPSYKLTKEKIIVAIIPEHYIIMLFGVQNGRLQVMTSLDYWRLNWHLNWELVIAGWPWRQRETETLTHIFPRNPSCFPLKPIILVYYFHSHVRKFRPPPRGSPAKCRKIPNFIF